MDNEVTLYRNELNGEEMDSFIKGICSSFSEALFMAEFFDRNEFTAFGGGDALKNRIDDLISIRIFDEKKQIKCRRIKDDLFWLTSDFSIDGWKKSSSGTRKDEQHIALWGYKSNDLGDLLYEERIPYLFSYPTRESLSARERYAITVQEFQDEEGRIFWDRFAAIGKWEG